MKMIFSQILRGVLAKVGFDLVRSRQFGVCPLRDAKTTLKGFGYQPCFFDVGANVGQTTHQLLDLWPDSQIHSFEPFSESYKTLAQSFNSHPNVKPHHCALARERGASILHLNAASVTNSLLPNAAEAGQFQPDCSITSTPQTVQITVETVDDMCSRLGLDFIHLLKTDTQGSDLQVLEGATHMINEKRVAMVLSEVLFVPLYEGQCWFEDIYRWMKSKGFQLVGLYNPTRDVSTGMLQWADALFLQPDVVQNSRNG